jgi:hypothetical protein
VREIEPAGAQTHATSLSRTFEHELSTRHMQKRVAIALTSITNHCNTPTHDTHPPTQIVHLFHPPLPVTISGIRRPHARLALLLIASQRPCACVAFRRRIPLCPPPPSIPVLLYSLFRHLSCHPVETVHHRSALPATFSCYCHSM